MTRRVLITGANRGIGLELTRLTLERGDRVFATCRSPQHARSLGQHEKLSLIELDVTSTTSTKRALAAIAELVECVDVLINNAGQNPRNGFDEFDAGKFLDLLDVNVVGPVRVTRAALAMLKRAEQGKVAFISSQLGSFELQAEGFGSLDYNVSKAALNMVNQKLAVDLGNQGILTVAIHPGWVRTSMGGDSAPIEPRESAAGILSVIDRLSPQTSGSFVRFDGSVHPW